MKKILLFFMIILAIMGKTYGEEIWKLDFETAGGYSTSTAEFTDGDFDYFIRTDGTDIGSISLNNIQGSYYFAAQDIDGEGAALPASLTIDDIDISGYSGLTFYIYLAEDDDGSEQDWDAGDYVHIDYDIDNSGSFSNLIHVEGSGSSAPAIDLNFDGSGNGTEITDTFAEFSGNITGTGSLIDIKISFNLDSGEEDIAIDGLRIEGTPNVYKPTDLSIDYITSEKMEVSWNSPQGTYDNVLIFCRSGNEVDHAPGGAGSGYSNADADFTAAGVYDNSRLVYSGTGNDVIVTNLTANTDYYFQAYAYDDSEWSQGTIQVNDETEVKGTSGFAADPQFGEEKINLSWTNYSGPQGTWWDEVLILAKKGSAVNATPTGDGSAYTANAVFASGTEVGTGNYVVYKGTGSNVSVTNIDNGETYYFRIFVNYNSAWTDIDEWESALGTNYSSVQDANRAITITEKDTDVLVAGNNKCFVVETELLDKDGNPTGDVTTTVSFKAWLNAEGTVPGNGELTTTKRTVSGTKLVYELKYTKAESIYLEAIAGNIDSVGQSADNFPATVTAGNPKYVQVLLSDDEITVDDYIRLDLTVVDEYSNSVDDLEEIWFDVQGRGLMSESTSRTIFSGPLELDADGKGKLYYHPSKYYVGNHSINIYWDGNNNGSDEGIHTSGAVVTTKSIKISAENVAQVLLQISGSAQGLTSYIDRTAVDTVGTYTLLKAELQDIYGNHIDAESTTDVTWSFGDSTVSKRVYGTYLDKNKNIITNYLMSRIIRPVNNVDSVIANIDNGFSSAVAITQISGPPHLFRVGTDTACTSANDSLLIAGNFSTKPDSIILLDLTDQYGNDVDNSYEITYETDGDGKFSNGKSSATSTLSSAGRSGSGLPFFAGRKAGKQNIIATCGAEKDSFYIEVLPTVPDSVSLIPAKIKGLVAGAYSEKIIAKVYDTFGNHTAADDSLFDITPVFALQDTNGKKVGLGSLTSIDTTEEGDCYVRYLANDKGVDSAAVSVDIGVGATTRYDYTSILCIKNLALATYKPNTSEMVYDTVAVGDWKTVCFEAFDINGNKKYDFEDTVKISLSNGTATKQQIHWKEGSSGTIFEAADDASVMAVLENGKINLKLLYEKAETGLYFQLKDEKHNIEISSGKFGYIPNIVDSLIIELPREIFQGVNNEYTVKAVDLYGNVNHSDEVRFKVTAKDPDALAIADNTRFIIGSETYIIKPTKVIKEQWLKYHSAMRRNEWGDDWEYLNANEGFSQSFNVKLNDIYPPEIIVDSPKENDRFGTSLIPVAGKIIDSSLVTLMINGQKQELINQNFDCLMDYGEFEGDTLVYLEAKDSKGNYAEKSVKILIDQTPPMISNQKPAKNEIVRTIDTKIEFQAMDELTGIMPSSILLKVDNRVVEPDYIDDVFSYWATDLRAMEHNYTIEIADSVGNVVRDTVDFTVNLDKLGDVNFDTAINGDDASLVLRYVSGKISFTGDTLLVADVTQDGTVSALDASWILRYWSGETDIFNQDALGKISSGSGGLIFSDVSIKNNGAMVEIPITLENPSHIFGLEIFVELNSTVMKIVELGIDLPEGWVQYYNITDKSLKLVLAGATPLTTTDLGILKLNTDGSGASSTLSGEFRINENQTQEMETKTVEALPRDYKLSQNYPNPFNPVTNINFQIPKKLKVTIEVFDIQGNKVKTLMNGELNAGYHKVSWNASNDFGDRQPSGLYFYSLQAGDFFQTRKMLLLK